MFGTTPRLNITDVRYNLFSDPSESLRIIRAWLAGYIAVTQTKDCEGDKSYRQQCMDFANTLSAKIPELGKKTYSNLSPEETRCFNELQGVISEFLLAETFPKKPRSKFSKFCQGILSALTIIPEAQEYESIYFLEDLEALLIFFKTHFFENSQFSLQYEGKTISLSFEALQASKVFCPLIKSFVYPLMRIAIQISPDRFEQLRRLHLAIPTEIQFSEDASLFPILFQLFEAISQDLVSGGNQEVEAHVTTLFHAWRKDGRDLTAFFDGDFGSKADNLLSILSSRFTETIELRVSTLVGKYSIALVEKDFFIGFYDLVKQYFLDSKTKVLFILELDKLNITDVLSFDGELEKSAAALIKRVTFTEEELSNLCQDREKLFVEEQIVVLHAVYVKLHEIFSSRNYDLFIDFISDQSGLLDLCIRHVESQLLEPLFSDLIPELLCLWKNVDSAFTLKLRERYQQAGIAYPFQVSSDDLLMHRFTRECSDPNRQVSPESDVHTGEMFPPVLPGARMSTTTEQSPSIKFNITAF